MEPANSMTSIIGVSVSGGFEETSTFLNGFCLAKRASIASRPEGHVALAVVVHSKNAQPTRWIDHTRYTLTPGNSERSSLDQNPPRSWGTKMAQRRADPRVWTFLEPLGAGAMGAEPHRLD